MTLIFLMTSCSNKTVTKLQVEQVHYPDYLIECPEFVPYKAKNHKDILNNYISLAEKYKVCKNSILNIKKFNESIDNTE